MVLHFVRVEKHTSVELMSLGFEISAAFHTMHMFWYAERGKGQVKVCIRTLRIGQWQRKFLPSILGDDEGNASVF